MTARRYPGREVELRPPPAAAPPASPPPDVPVQMYTLEEASKRLAVCHETLLRAVRKGSVHGVKIGRHWRISEAELRRVSVEGAAC
jgi:excisionase family DNA binding protein